MEIVWDENKIIWLGLCDEIFDRMIRAQKRDPKTTPELIEMLLALGPVQLAGLVGTAIQRMSAETGNLT